MMKLPLSPSIIALELSLHSVISLANLTFPDTSSLFKTETSVRGGGFITAFPTYLPLTLIGQFVPESYEYLVLLSVVFLSPFQPSPVVSCSCFLSHVSFVSLPSSFHFFFCRWRRYTSSDDDSVPVQHKFVMRQRTTWPRPLRLFGCVAVWRAEHGREVSPSLQTTGDYQGQGAVSLIHHIPRLLFYSFAFSSSVFSSFSLARPLFFLPFSILPLFSVVFLFCCSFLSLSLSLSVSIGRCGCTCWWRCQRKMAMFSISRRFEYAEWEMTEHGLKG